MNNDVKFAIKNVIGEFVKVETVDVTENEVIVGVPLDHDKHDVLEPLLPVGLVVIDDDHHEVDDNQRGKMVEMVEMVRVLMVDDEVVAVDDDDDEDFEMVEMVEIDDTQINKFHDQTVEMVEIPECIERGENDDVVDPFIIHDDVEPHETVEIDIFEAKVEIDENADVHEMVDVESLSDEKVEIDCATKEHETDEMQSRMYIDFI